MVINHPNSPIIQANVTAERSRADAAERRLSEAGKTLRSLVDRARAAAFAGGVKHERGRNRAVTALAVAEAEARLRAAKAEADMTKRTTDAVIRGLALRGNEALERVAGEMLREAEEAANVARDRAAYLTFENDELQRLLMQVSL